MIYTMQGKITTLLKRNYIILYIN